LINAVPLRTQVSAESVLVPAAGAFCPDAAAASSVLHTAINHSLFFMVMSLSMILVWLRNISPVHGMSLFISDIQPDA
jgi:hypothetical protein